MSRKLVALILMGLLIGAIFVPTAAQAQFVGGIDCKADLPLFPTEEPLFATCEGQAFGVAAGGSVTCLPPDGCQVEVTATYNEPCLGLPAGFPPLGTSTGTITVDGDDVGDYDWVRVGATAVIVPLTGDTAGVGVLLAGSDGTPGPIGTCGNPLPTQVHVVGFGAVI